MPTFRYRAYTSSGAATTGDIEAAGPREAAEKLKKTGLFPFEVKESSIAERDVLARLGLRKVSKADLALATRQLATLLGVGTPITEALYVLSENTANPGLKEAILRIREEIAGGKTLAGAMGAYPEIFSRFYRGLVASGEEGGALDRILARLADYLETRVRVERELYNALTYPALMILVGVGVLSFLFVFVIPKITRIFEDSAGALPFATIMLIWLARTMRTYWPVILIIIGGGLWGLNRFRDNARFRDFRDRLFIRLPWAGRLVADFYVTNMTRTLGNLLKGGVPLIRSLELTREVLDNTVFARILKEAAADCTGGGSLAASLKKHNEIPRIVAHMIGVGEKSGHLDEILLKAADESEAEFNASLKRAISLAEPLLILTMGLVVGFVVLSILLPIFELNQLIK